MYPVQIWFDYVSLLFTGNVSKSDLLRKLILKFFRESESRSDANFCRILVKVLVEKNAWT